MRTSSSSALICSSDMWYFSWFSILTKASILWHKADDALKSQLNQIILFRPFHIFYVTFFMARIMHLKESHEKKRKNADQLVHSTVILPAFFTKCIGRPLY